jgi:hypothetical protein
MGVVAGKESASNAPRTYGKILIFVKLFRAWRHGGPALSKRQRIEWELARDMRIKLPEKSHGLWNQKTVARRSFSPFA